MIQTYQKPMKNKLNTNKINTMEDRRTQGNGRGAQRFRLFSFLLQTGQGQGHPGPRFGLSHIQGGQSKGPWCHFPPPWGPLVLRRGVYLSTPIINHTTRTMMTGEMRTNWNALLKKNPVTNAGVDKAASCWSGLLPHSAVWCWVGGKHGPWGRVNSGGERRKGRSCFPHQLFQGWNSTSDPRSRSISGSYRTSSTVSEEPGGHSSMAPGLSAGVSS